MGRDNARAAGTATASIGTVIAATLAAACCSGPLLGPLIVASLGASGAAALAGLKPYSPYLFGASLVMLVLGFWTAYKPARRCTTIAYRPTKRFTLSPMKSLLWVAAGIWIVAVTFTILSLAKS